MVYLDPKSRASAWSVTAFFDTPNTPSKETRQYQIDAARSKGWTVEGQVEKCPETGNLHFQLRVKTPQVRARALMDAFPQAEVQIARNDKALQNYVHKEETRVEEFKSVKMFVSWPMLRDKFYDWLLLQLDVTTIGVLDEERLKFWDEFIGQSWVEGIECDLMGVNPQYRGCILKYWSRGVEIADARRQKTDRQTDTQEVSLPTIHNTDGVGTVASARSEEDSKVCPQDEGASGNGSLPSEGNRRPSRRRIRATISHVC